MPVDTDAAAGPATLMVRPEAVELASITASSNGPALVGRVAHVAFMGNHTRIAVETASGTVVAQRPTTTHAGQDASDVRPGEEVRIWWRPDLATILPSDNGGSNGGSTV
jgi:ABC-type Fe3+/spermidine/putrescine transport system ATPase subunit